MSTPWPTALRAPLASERLSTVPAWAGPGPRTTDPTVGARSLPGISNRPSVPARVLIRRSWSLPSRSPAPRLSPLHLRRDESLSRIPSQIKNPRNPIEPEDLAKFEGLFRSSASRNSIVDSGRSFEHLVCDSRRIFRESSFLGSPVSRKGARFRC
jgi:hypothetical protein